MGKHDLDLDTQHSLTHQHVSHGLVHVFWTEQTAQVARRLALKSPQSRRSTHNPHSSCLLQARLLLVDSLLLTQSTSTDSPFLGWPDLIM